MLDEMIELVRDAYKTIADEDELWQSLAMMSRKFVDALVKEGFSREEALTIVAKMPNIMQFNK